MEKKEDNKKEIKKSIIAGVGTVSGAAIGSVIENNINPLYAEANDIADNAAEGEVEDSEDISVIVEEVNENPVDESNRQDDVMSTKPSNVGNTSVSGSAHSFTDGMSTISGPGNIVSGDEVVATSSVNELMGEEIITEPSIVEIQSVDDDIQIVSIESDDEENSLIAEAYIPTEEMDAFESTTGELNYMDEPDTKANKLDSFSSSLEDMDMPDYVNDANIDSFTDMV